MIRRYILLIVIVIIPDVCTFGADSTKSLVLKNFAPERIPFRLQRDNSAEVLWDAFMTVQKANSGDPVAQHELGLRYLVGRDFSPDTTKAAHWIGKAAEQHLITAEYNYGLLLNNGWGVSWNPFEAYRHFQYAAMHGLAEAEYVFGLLRTDNLVVERNYDEAYRWIKTAADSGFAPATEVLKEFAARGIMAKINSHRKQSQDKKQSTQPKTSANPVHSLKPIFLDFDTDSIPEPDYKTLLKDVVNEKDNGFKDISESVDPIISADTLDMNTIRSIHDAAEAGSPEALTMMGRLYEQGLGVKTDVYQASVYYIRAIRFDSPWSPMLMWNMMRKGNYFPRLKELIDEGNPAAKFVWSGLIDLGFDNQLTEAQALALLEDASLQDYTEAIVQLGVCHYTGHWVKQDKEKAIQLLNRAEQLGNREAKIRLCTIKLKDGERKERPEELVRTLQQFSLDGSVLALAALGYCYQEGIGVPADKSESIRLYRRAAQRGSNAAYDALRNFYDDLRPNDPEFQIAE